MPDWRTIRKPGGSLLIRDLLEYPVWEYAIDEEGLPGQDEATMRPFVSTVPIQLDFGGFIATDFTAANGRRWIGTIDAGAPSNYPYLASPCIWLDRPIKELVSDPLLAGYNPVMYNDSRGISFTLPLPQYLSDQKCRGIFPLVYRVLGIRADQLFPITLQPRHPVAGWEQGALLHGFLRPREVGAPDTILT